MKILVIRFKQMGDAILDSVICTTLKKSFPNSEIDYVLYEHVAPIFKYNKNIDNVITITNEVKKNGLKYLWEVFKITRKKYDIVIDLMNNPKSELFTFFSGAKYRIGRARKHRGYTYTHKLDVDNGEGSKVDKTLALLKPLEKEYEIKYDDSFPLIVTDEEKNYMKNIMIEKGIDFSKPIIATSVTTLRELKRYPREKMIKVLNLILEKYPDVQMIFFWTKDQKEYVQSYHTELKENKRIFSNIETKSVREFLGLLANCNMYFGNEGGARHMAQALDIPSFAVFFPESNTKEWIPRNNGRHKGIISSDKKDDFTGMTRDEIFNLITPEDLLKGFEDIYKNI